MGWFKDFNDIIKEKLRQDETNRVLKKCRPQLEKTVKMWDERKQWKQSSEYELMQKEEIKEWSDKLCILTQFNEGFEITGEIPCLATLNIMALDAMKPYTGMKPLKELLREEYTPNRALELMGKCDMANTVMVLLQENNIKVNFKDLHVSCGSIELMEKFDKDIFGSVNLDMHEEEFEYSIRLVK